jgi:hypothetical protein
MEAWAWLAVYLVGFALLQLVLYRYFRKRRSGDQPAGPDGRHGARADAGRDSQYNPASERADPGGDGRRSGDGADGVHCGHCGALNEDGSTYTYCRQCARPLR